MNKGGRKLERRVRNLKMYIINNPSVRNYEQLADMFDVCKATVFAALRDLNIQPRKRPKFCRG